MGKKPNKPFGGSSGSGSAAAPAARQQPNRDQAQSQKQRRRSGGGRFIVLGALLLATLTLGYVGFSVHSHGMWTPLSCSLSWGRIGCPTVSVFGHLEPQLASIRTVFEDILEEHEAMGQQLVVYKNGRLIVDLWGHIGLDGYDGNSLQSVFSIGKVLGALGVLREVDAGRLDLEQPIAMYWPEFAQGGKGNVLVKDLQRHQAGLFRLDAGPSPSYVRVSQKQDGPTSADDGLSLRELIERSPYAHPEANTTRAYHGMSLSWIQRELVRRVDPKQRDDEDVIEEEVLRPLGAASDVHIGLSADSADRRRLFCTRPMESAPLAFVFKVVLPLLLRVNPEKSAALAKMRQPGTPLWHMLHSFNHTDINARPGDPTWMCRPDATLAEHSSYNTQASARGMGIVAAALSLRGANLKSDGPRILSEATFKNSLRLSKDATQYDSAFSKETTFTDGGFAVLAPGYYGWVGWSGSALMFNPEKQIAIVYVPASHELGDLPLSPRSRRLFEEIVKVVV